MVYLLEKNILTLQTQKNIMKAIRYLLFFITTMMLFSCNNGDEFYFENLIEKAYTARCTRNLQDINIDSLAIVDAVCMEKKDLRGSCICEGIIGYSKFFERDYLTALVMLKNAESKLQYCDSMSAFVYHYLSEILATEDTVVALQYINKAIEIAIKQENKIDQINAYRQKANLVGEDSARVYIEEASRISIEIDDTIQNMLCWSRYAINYYDKLHPDSIIKFVKPFCEIRPYALDQMVLAEAYIRKGMTDSATYYISLFEGHPLFQIDKYYLSGKIAEINHNFDNAAMSYRLAYETYDKEINKYLKLQLSGKNTQYDMQQLKIEAQKEKMALFKTIIILLIAIIIVILVLILSYFVIKRHKGKIDLMQIKQNSNQIAYNKLLNQYVSKYTKNINRETIIFEANNILEKVRIRYPELTKTDIAIIWLLYLNKNKEFITNMLSITDAYYFQRRTIIYRAFDFSSVKELDLKMKDFITNILFE